MNNSIRSILITTISALAVIAFFGVAWTMYFALQPVIPQSSILFSGIVTIVATILCAVVAHVLESNEKEHVY